MINFTNVFLGRIFLGDLIQIVFLMVLVLNPIQGRPNNFPDLDSMFSNHGFSEPQPLKGKDIRQEFFISFQEAALGTQRQIIIELNGNTRLKQPLKYQQGLKMARA